MGDVEGYLSDGVTVSAPGVSVQSGEGLSVSVVSTASVLSGGCVVAEAGELVIVSAGRGCGSRRDRAVGGDSCGDTLATAGAAVWVDGGDRLTEVSGRGGGGDGGDGGVGGDRGGDTLATAGAAVRVVSGDRRTEVSG